MASVVPRSIFNILTIHIHSYDSMHKCTLIWTLLGSEAAVEINNYTEVKVTLHIL